MLLNRDPRDGRVTHELSSRDAVALACLADALPQFVAESNCRLMHRAAPRMSSERTRSRNRTEQLWFPNVETPFRPPFADSTGNRRSLAVLRGCHELTAIRMFPWQQRRVRSPFPALGQIAMRPVSHTVGSGTLRPVDRSRSRWAATASRAWRA